MPFFNVSDGRAGEATARLPGPCRSGDAACPMVALKILGHKTEAVYRRHAIVTDSDLLAAALKLAESPRLSSTSIRTPPP